MIHGVRADRPSFKAVSFEPGFNVVIAERTAEATQKDSRNGLGKTSLIEIIHFCLGASASKNSPLQAKALQDWTFSLDIDLRGKRYTIHRNTSNPAHIFVEGDMRDWPIQPKVKRGIPEASLSLREWTILLGWLVFDLPLPTSDNKYQPTFRSLISYFARKGRDAYTIPFQHFRNQLTWDQQVNNAFLLGLNWEYASTWQKLKDRRKALDQLSQVAKSGLMPNFVGTIGDLESHRVRLEQSLNKTGQELANFRVHTEYDEIEKRANNLTTQCHNWANQNLHDSKIIELYESDLDTEQSAQEDALSQLYEEAGIVLPTNVVRRLEEVKSFHARITSDRKNFLQNEIQRLKIEIAARKAKIREADSERAALLQILQTHGALDEFTKLQRRHLESVAELEEIKTRLDNLRNLEGEKSELKIQQERLLLETRRDLEERAPIRDRAIALFNINSEALYESPGDLIINLTDAGYKFDVEIERSSSQGVEQMKVFCYDLVLAQLWAEREFGPGFLIHDSTIFDGVDERQVAQALQLAALEAETCGFQYICFLNSDMIPSTDFEVGFDLNSFKHLELTDATEDGGLFGIRY